MFCVHFALCVVEFSKQTMQEETCSMPSGFGWSFEVTGKVQGVFFRKHTILKAQQLGLAGWVRNTRRGTVEGQIAARTQAKLDEMKDWLQNTGSPASRIDGAHFAALTAQQIEQLLHENNGEFQKRKTV